MYDLYSTEVFIDDFLFVGDTFEACLEHLGKVLQKCVETNFTLDWEKCHFMVKEDIVLALKISGDEHKLIRLRMNLFRNFLLLFLLKVFESSKVKHVSTICS